MSWAEGLKNSLTELSMNLLKYTDKQKIAFSCISEKQKLNKKHTTTKTNKKQQSFNFQNTIEQ